MSNLLKLKADEIDAICGLIGIAKCKNVTEICTTTNNTTAKIKMKPVKRKRKYIPKMKCVVEGCKALSRGNGVGKNGEYCLRHGGRRYPRKCTYDGCNHYILRSKLCAKHYLLWEKELRLHNTGVVVVDIQQQVNCTLPKQE